MSIENRAVIAIAVSDLHLTLTPPPARSGEVDWLRTQRHTLNQIRALCMLHHVPALYAGDIFDTWKAPAELINFAIDYMPHGYAIPGQHDLPHHAYDDIERSPYWTLAKAGVISHLHSIHPTVIKGADVYGFSWGQPIMKEPETKYTRIRIALLHEYVWHGDAKYEGATEEQSDLKRFKGWDTVIIGDNHKSWQHKNAFNCGGLFRRHSDEKNHTPRVGLIYENGKVESHYLDISQDVFEAKTKSKLESHIDTKLSLFLHNLENLSRDTLDYPEAMRHTMDKMNVTPQVRKLLEEAMK